MVPDADKTYHDETALLRAFAQGDRSAAVDLTRQLTPRLLAQAYRMLGVREEAEDVVQEAMLRLWRRAGDLELRDASVSTWIHRVVVNLCIDRLRLRKPTLDIEGVEEPVDDRPNAEETLTARTRAQALRLALADLPERQAKAVALRHLEEMNNPEVAEIMGESVRTVESLIARGKRGLIDRLMRRKSELGYEDDR